MKQDYAQAIEWYRKAADHGDAAAEFNLGWLYEHGAGVEKDEAQASAWYGKAAAHGRADAKDSLARLTTLGHASTP